MDIALLPEFRNTGIGTKIMEDLMAEAVSAQRAVVLQREVFNRPCGFMSGWVCKERGTGRFTTRLVWKPATSMPDPEIEFIWRTEKDVGENRPKRSWLNRWGPSSRCWTTRPSVPSHPDPRG